MAYSNGWNSTDQVAQRAIDQGTIDRFGIARSDRWRHLQPLQPVRQLGAVERLRPEQRQRLCRSAPTCSCSTTSPTFSTTPSMATSSTSSTAARSAASTHAMPSTGGFGGFETQTRVGLQSRYDDIHVGLFKTEQRNLALDRARGPGAGRQRRLLDRFDHALDRLAAHHGRPPRGCLRRPRPERHAGEFRQRAGRR